MRSILLHSKSENIIPLLTKKINQKNIEQLFSPHERISYSKIFQIYLEQIHKIIPLTSFDAFPEVFQWIEHQIVCIFTRRNEHNDLLIYLQLEKAVIHEDLDRISQIYSTNWLHPQYDNGALFSFLNPSDNGFRIFIFLLAQCREEYARDFIFSLKLWVPREFWLKYIQNADLHSHPNKRKMLIEIVSWFDLNDNPQIRDLEVHNYTFPKALEKLLHF